ncbi:hypothetical protein ACFPVX_15110 [Cohnella faecalis]|uniref:XRE family transcriptional regulator n=1 Tax=Cohnella faecalis TaxID=2315694 RepID=A0A398CG98_9BACL|nr:hypothetical protein [Cohnella faecalis]RIE01753.1 hypothetical protein D3H35_13195 [Cohnella faecalis]
MKLNKAALIRHMNENFNGNYAWLAWELKIDVAYVYAVLVNDKKCGELFLKSIIRWCDENNTDFREYIFLP